VEQEHEELSLIYTIKSIIKKI